MSFFQSFTETLLHSLWQIPVLLIFYLVINTTVKSLHPLQKRNALFFITAAQILFSSVTFYLFYTNTAFGKTGITGLLSGKELLLPAQYASLLFYVWLGIALAKSSMVLKQWITFKRNLNANFIRPAAALKVFTELKSYHLGIKHKVTLWLSANITTPITYGFFKPVILLPFSLMNDISQEEAETIILHELAHIKNRDYLLNWLLVSAEIIYFFNPFIKIISNKIKLEREKNCDVQVINFEYSPVSYARVLLKIARKKHELMSFQLAAAKKTSHLLQRVRFFSDEKNFKFSNARSGIIAGPALILITLSGFFLLPKKEKSAPVSAAPMQVNIKNTESVVVVSTAAFRSEEKTTHDFVSLQTAETILPQPGTDQINADTVFELPEIPLLNVAYKEPIDSIKEFIYDVETPQGKVTQSFKLTLINGQWIFEPMWMLTETRPDSLRILISKDSIQ